MHNMSRMSTVRRRTEKLLRYYGCQDVLPFAYFLRTCLSCQYTRKNEQFSFICWLELRGSSLFFGEFISIFSTTSFTWRILPLISQCSGLKNELFTCLSCMSVSVCVSVGTSDDGHETGSKPKKKSFARTFVSVCCTVVELRVCVCVYM